MKLMFLSTWSKKDKLDFIKAYHTTDRSIMGKLYKMGLSELNETYNYLILYTEFTEQEKEYIYGPNREEPIRMNHVVFRKKEKPLREENAWLKAISADLRKEMVDYYKIHTVEQFKEEYFAQLGFQSKEVPNSKVLIRLTIVCRSMSESFPKFKGCKDASTIAANMINTGKNFTCKRFHITQEELDNILKEAGVSNDPIPSV